MSSATDDALADDEVALPAATTGPPSTPVGPAVPAGARSLVELPHLGRGGPHLDAAGHEVVAVDQRGHGRSEAPDDGYTTDRCADDLLALTEQLGLSGRRRVAVGQSWGGNVVVRLAARHGMVSGGPR